MESKANHHKNLLGEIDSGIPSNIKQKMKMNISPKYFKVGDLVVVAQDNIEKSKWPLARVIGINVGKYWILRSVKLKN